MLVSKLVFKTWQPLELSITLALKLANKLDARNDLLNLTIGDLKLANKLVVAMEEDGEALEAMEEASSTIGALKLANKLDARRDLPSCPDSIDGLALSMVSMV